jgi:hypothetical protein
MKITAIIDRFENEMAVLKANSNLVLEFPKKILPDLPEGSAVTIEILPAAEHEKRQKQLAKDILNELLDTG